jgi:amidase
LDEGVATFITPLQIGSGLPVAIKDIIDLEGEVTTAGCRGVAASAGPASADAACLSEIRRRAELGEVRIVGKTNLHELAFGTTGRNPWYGTPRNPLDPSLVPGGSSSGSAVAVARGDADVALGSDTGGSVRIPAACCGVAGLKTTWGRIPLDGVYPLAPSLDTIGPMARDIEGLVVGMQLLEPGFTVATASDALTLARVRVEAEPAIDAAVDAAVARSGLPVSDLAVPGWQSAWESAALLIAAEAWRANRDLLARAPDGVSGGVRGQIEFGGTIGDDQLEACRAAQRSWQDTLARHLTPETLLVLPTLPVPPPPLEVRTFDGSRLTLPVNFAGLPALALPAPTTRGLPASLQLIGPPGGEEVLLAAGRIIEAAA